MGEPIESSHAVTGGNSSIIAYMKGDNNRLTNDHGSLRRSGDYQSKIHK